MALPEKLAACGKLMALPLLPPFEQIDRALDQRSADEDQQEQLEIEQREQHAEDDEGGHCGDQCQRRACRLDHEPAIG